MDARPTPDRTRREGIASLPIKLADGHKWGLALPSTRLRLKVVESVNSLGRPTESFQVATEFGYPLEIRRLVDELRIACDQPVTERQYESLIRVAAALIRRAHDIDLTETMALLELGDNDLLRLVETVLSAVTGESLDNAVPSRK